MLFRRMRGSTADLMVSGNGILAIIRVQYTPRLQGNPAEFAAQFRDAIALLRIHPSGGPVSRELWLYTRYGVFRFFRVEDDGIVEIGPDGKVLSTRPVIPEKAGRPRSRRKLPAAADEASAREALAVPASGSGAPIVLPEPVAEDSPGGPCN